MNVVITILFFTLSLSAQAGLTLSAQIGTYTIEAQDELAPGRARLTASSYNLYSLGYKYRYNSTSYTSLNSTYKLLQLSQPSNATLVGETQEFWGHQIEHAFRAGLSSQLIIILFGEEELIFERENSQEIDIKREMILGGGLAITQTFYESKHMQLKATLQYKIGSGELIQDYKSYLINIGPLFKFVNLDLTYKSSKKEAFGQSFKENTFKTSLGLSF